MSWISNNPLTWFQRFCINVIKTGHVPKHVAFIMDGNRRFAKKTNVTKIDGHSKGFEKLTETLVWCKELGITEVTVYAFSIDNFKRTKEEVDSLMELATNKFKTLLDEKDKIMKNGLCVRVVGNLSYLNPELRQVIAEIMILTEKNTTCFLNIAFSYSSRDEITNSVKCIMEGVNDGLLDIKDIDEQLISECMYTNKSPDPDLLIRTSGEMRLSDFLLWQISCTQVHFSDILWPELSLWHLLKAIFKYQTHYCDMLPVKKTKALISNKCSQNNPRVAKFLENVELFRRNQLESYMNA